MAAKAVELQIPASSAYLALTRAATAAICAKSDYRVDQLEDVTLAVNEAVALLLKDVRPGSPVDISYRTWEPDATTASNSAGLTIKIYAATRSGRLPRTNNWTWQVLTTLVDDVFAELVDDGVALTLASHRQGGSA